MDGRIHSTQSLGTVDGPGVRFVVFLQGCPLRCGYCHNPDTWEVFGGSLVSATELMGKISRFKPYFGPEGGVTVSGGEALLQPDFVYELFTLCREKGIHTALDTSGCLLSDKIERLLTVTDLVLLDIKMTTDPEYRKYVGCSIDSPLRFLHELGIRGIDTWIRQVIVPGLNDTAENLERLSSLLKGKEWVKKVELLPFQKLCVGKYEELHLVFPFEGYPSADPAEVARLERTYFKPPVQLA